MKLKRWIAFLFVWVLAISIWLSYWISRSKTVSASTKVRVRVEAARRALGAPLSPDDIVECLRSNRSGNGSFVDTPMPSQLLGLSHELNRTSFAKRAWRTAFNLVSEANMTGETHFTCLPRRFCKKERVRSRQRDFKCRLLDDESQALAMATNLVMLEHYRTLYAQQVSSNSSIEIFLLVLTKSAPRNYAKRKTVREGWLGLAQSNNRGACGQETRGCEFSRWDFQEKRDPFLWFHQFVVGLRIGEAGNLVDSLFNEQGRERDLLIYPENDSYRRLTWKTIWQMAWAQRTLSFEYLLMLDDDNFVRFDLVADYLTRKRRKILYSGFVTGFGLVERHRKSRWFVDWNRYEYLWFPPYAWGAGIFMSRYVAERCLVQAAKKPEKRWFGVDDAFIGVLLRKEKITPRSLKNMHLQYPEKLQLFDCDSPGLVRFSMITINISTAKFRSMTTDSGKLKLCPGEATDPMDRWTFEERDDQDIEWKDRQTKKSIVASLLKVLAFFAISALIVTILGDQSDNLFRLVGRVWDFCCSLVV